MAIRGLSMAEREQYILKADPGHPEHDDFKKAQEKGEAPEAPTIFYIGNLSSADRVELADMGATPTMRDGGITMKGNAFQKAWTAVQRGLKGWDNFVDENGNAIEFKTQTTQTTSGFRAVVSDDCLGRLGRDEIHELANEVLRKNGLTSEMEKNFAGALQQPAVQPFETGAVTPAPTISGGSEVAQPPQNSPEQSPANSEAKTEG